MLVCGYDNLHRTIAHVTSDARRYLFLFCWNFDIEFSQLIRAAIVQATQRGVSVFIMVSGLDWHLNDFSRLSGVDSRYLHIRNGISIGPDLDEYMRLLGGAFHSRLTRSVFNHIRLCMSERLFLLGGCNSSSKYNGAVHQNISADNPYCWYDSGLYTHIPKSRRKRLYHYMRRLYDDMHHEMARVNVASSLRPYRMLMLNNEDVYAECIRAIRASRRRIYIEGQYFISHPQFTYNQFALELGRRLRCAIHSNDGDFRIVILVNSLNYDENPLIQMLLRTFCELSLHSVRESAAIMDDDCERSFQRQLRVYVPRLSSNPSIIVHSKILIVDDSLAMYKTGDIYDNCTSNLGNMELALRLKSPCDVNSLYAQCMAEFRKHRSLFVKYHWPGPAGSLEHCVAERLLMAYRSLNLAPCYYGNSILPFSYST